MKYKLAIFDMDGTLLDTLADLNDCLNFALGRRGYPLRNMCEVRRFVGNGIRKLIERGVPENTSVEDVDSVHEEFKKYYSEHYADKTKPYDGIIDLLKALKNKGVSTAVVSNKADFAVRKLVTRYFDNLFDIAVGEKQSLNKKPAPDSVFEALNLLAVDKQDAVYIGDSEVDIQTAKNAGIDSAIVTWGFRDKDFLSKMGAQRFADSAQDIMKIIEG